MIKALLGGGMYLLFVFGIILKWRSERKAKTNTGKVKARPTPETIDMLDNPIEALQHDNWRKRLQAIHQLMENPTNDAILPLVNLLDDTDPDVRETASEALAHYGKSAIEPVVSVLKNESLDARIAAIHALAKMHIPETVDGLSYALLHDESIWVRLPAVHALANYPDQQIIATLTQALHDTNREVYDAVVNALKHINTPETKQAIQAHPYQAKSTHQDNNTHLG